MDVIETAPPPVMEEDISSPASPPRAPRRRLQNVQTVATIGLAADEIVSQAINMARTSSCLARTPRAIYHLFAGSVVTGVLKRSHTPVIVVPSANAPRKRCNS